MQLGGVIGDGFLVTMGTGKFGSLAEGLSTPRPFFLGHHITDSKIDSVFGGPFGGQESKHLRR